MSSCNIPHHQYQFNWPICPPVYYAYPSEPMNPTPETSYCTERTEQKLNKKSPPNTENKHEKIILYLLKLMEETKPINKTLDNFSSLMETAIIESNKVSIERLQELSNKVNEIAAAQIKTSNTIDKIQKRQTEPDAIKHIQLQLDSLISTVNQQQEATKDTYQLMMHKMEQKNTELLKEINTSHSELKNLIGKQQQQCESNMLSQSIWKQRINQRYIDQSEILHALQIKHKECHEEYVHKTENTFASNIELKREYMELFRTIKNGDAVYKPSETECKLDTLKPESKSDNVASKLVLNQEKIDENEMDIKDKDSASQWVLNQEKIDENEMDINDKDGALKLILNQEKIDENKTDINDKDDALKLILNQEKIDENKMDINDKNGALNLVLNQEKIDEKGVNINEKDGALNLVLNQAKIDENGADINDKDGALKLVLNKHNTTNEAHSTAATKADNIDKAKETNGGDTCNINKMHTKTANRRRKERKKKIKTRNEKKQSEKKVQPKPRSNIAQKNVTIALKTNTSYPKRPHTGHYHSQQSRNQNQTEMNTDRSIANAAYDPYTEYTTHEYGGDHYAEYNNQNEYRNDNYSTYYSRHDNYEELQSEYIKGAYYYRE